MTNKKDLIITQMLNAGMPRAKIAEHFGVTPSAITNWAKKRGFSDARSTRKAKAREAYKAGATLTQIMEQYGWTKETASRYIYADTREELWIFGKIYRRWNLSHHFCSRDGELIIYEPGQTTYLLEVKMAALTDNPQKDYLCSNNGEPLHSIIFETWVRERQQGEEVYHLNGDTRDNRIENLAVGTRADMVKQAIKNETHVSVLRKKGLVPQPFANRKKRALV